MKRVSLFGIVETKVEEKMMITINQRFKTLLKKGQRLEFVENRRTNSVLHCAVFVIKYIYYCN